MRSKLDHDRLVNADPKSVSVASMKVIDAIQSDLPHVQVAAISASFLAVCAAHRVNPQDVFTATSNLLSDTIHGERPEFRALRLYTQHELTK